MMTPHPALVQPASASQRPSADQESELEADRNPATACCLPARRRSIEVPLRTNASERPSGDHAGPYTRPRSSVRLPAALAPATPIAERPLARTLMYATRRESGVQAGSELI